MRTPAKMVLVANALAVHSARAGMPSFDLNDVVGMRLQDISFFLLLVVLSAVGLKLLWGFSFESIPKVPPLRLSQALGLTLVLGLLMLLVLSMISGARELLTPGAWRKQGLTYQLNSPASLEQRRARLLGLHAALQRYARDHDGKFPSHESVQEIPPWLWQSADPDATRFVYVSWAPTDQPQAWIVLEPRAFGSGRLGLAADGTVRVISDQEVRQVFRSTTMP